MTDNEKLAPYYTSLNVSYIGQLKRLNDYPLDTFHDWVTGTGFTRLPFESLEQAIERARAAYKKRREEK